MDDRVTPASPPRRTLPVLRRLLFHGALAVASCVVAGTILVWPQWVALDGARAALAVQVSREEEITERLTTMRTLLQSLREWKKTERRVLLPEELRSLASLVRTAAAQEGARAAAVEVTDRPSMRWRNMAIPGGGLEDAAGDEAAGEIRPRVVRLVLVGSFDSVYRTVAGLASQQWLWIPDRWDLSVQPGAAGTAASGSRSLRAEVCGTVFVVHEPRPTLGAPAPIRQLARALVPGEAR
ncbi:MAG: hypothetical protein FJX77_01380 [Armatimonadetes bacterium]|nr:hypothetical protein [Armatimonadota bacterium]